MTSGPARAVIVGSGAAIPPNKITNEMLSRVMDTSDEWIRERSGVETRYYVDPGTATAPLTYDLAVEPKQRSDLPLPLHSQEVQITDAAVQRAAVTLHPAALAHGRVLTPSAAPIADVRVGYYSVESGSLEHPLLVGLGQTNEVGEYVIPIPAAQSK